MALAHQIVRLLLDAQSRRFGLKTFEPAVASSPGSGEELKSWLQEPGSDYMARTQGAEKKVHEEPVYPGGRLEYYQGQYGGWRILWRELETGTVIGVIQGVSRGRLHIGSNIYVVPERRRQRVATVLVNAAKQWKRGLKASSALTSMGRALLDV
jgi:GNAT superfamily N-acetyltransferase